MNNFKSLGSFGVFILILAVAYALVSHNPLITLFAVITPFILMKLTWKNTESPILFVAMMTQYLAITVKVFYANSNNLAFNDSTLHRSPEYIIQAYYWSLMGLIALALGIHLAIRNFNKYQHQDILEISLKFQGNKLMWLYIAAAIAYPILFRLSFTLGGLQQPLSRLTDFKWAIFFIFMVNSMHGKKVKPFILIFITELLFSFTGFFSSFKDYFLVLFIGMIMVYGKTLKPGNLIPLGTVAALGLTLLFTWQYIKPAYRNFLNDGKASQSSVRSTDESFEKLYDLIGEMEEENLNDGYERTIDRLSYIDFLAATMSNVPSNIKHTDGEQWAGAIERVLKPRILFPGKAAIDDSEKASLYTGQPYRGADQGVSVSLGYFAESYVDFGRIGMVLILMIFGFIIGKIYRYVLSSAENLLIGTALAIPLFFTIFNYEKALEKIFGALFMYLIVYLIIKAFLLKPALRYLNYKEN